MASPFLAEIRIVTFNFAPRGYAFCDGQILPIAQNTALFSLLGTTYGGNGQNTFALPELRGRVPMGPGSGAGLTARALGEIAGETSVTLTQAQLPAHTHQAMAAADSGLDTPANNVWGTEGRSRPPAYSSGTNVQMNSQTISSVGGNVPHNNMQPYLALYYVIALQGVFPSRS